MEGEKGEPGKAADFCKGAEACSSCKKGKRVWLERKAGETGICYSYSTVKGGEGMEQSCLPPEEEGPCPQPHPEKDWGMDQDFHLYTSRSISSLEKKTKTWQEAGFQNPASYRKGQRGT